LARETEVLLGENLPQRHFYPSQNPTWPDPGLNPGRRDGKPATNRLSYGAALVLNLLLQTRISALFVMQGCRLFLNHWIVGWGSYAPQCGTSTNVCIVTEIQTRDCTGRNTEATIFRYRHMSVLSFTENGNYVTGVINCPEIHHPLQ
jgi:hypothetical protein